MLLPPQPHEKIPLFVNAADLVVAPYKKVAKNYGTPLKILETLARAKPVAITDTQEFKLWFRGAPIYYYSSESELEEIALKLLRHSDALREKLLKASEQVRTRFSWDALAASTGRSQSLLTRCGAKVSTTSSSSRIASTNSRKAYCIISNILE